MLKFSVVVLCAVICVVRSKEEVYHNSWAVEVRAGHQAANKLAEKHGFVNKGQIGSLEGFYHFVHSESPSRERRSVDTLHPKHHDLMAEEHVSYVEQQVLKSRVKRDHSFQYTSPTDNKWSNQWYLHRPNGHDMNIEKAWEMDVIGRGAVVSILDDGLEYTHPDLKANYDPLASYDFNAHDDDPFPRYDYSNENKHGTRCAGEVAANRDGLCGVGAAYGAKVGGVRMLDGDVTDVVEASSLSLNSQHIQIYSSSWGPSDNGQTVDGPGLLASKAFIDGIEKGRGGLGSLFVWAAGNGGRYGDSCNCDGYAVSPFTISVGSASEKDSKPWYLEKCSSTLVSTYSSGSTGEKQIISTDLHGKCTAHHTGTSAAAPLAAGIMALALEVNSNLTWRDMQYLLVYTSNPKFAHESNWITNGAGLRVSHLYGFGIIDATALVNRARNWITVPSRINCTVNVTKTLNNAISTPAAPLNVQAMFGSDCTVSYIEHTQAFVTLKLLAGKRRDVNIKLTSPQGTSSLLLPNRRSDSSKEGFHKWPFMTVLTWGETPTGGDWVLTVTTSKGAKASLTGFELVVHGTQGTPRSIRNVPTNCDPQCKGGCFGEGPEHCDDCLTFRMFSTLACVEACPVGSFQNHHMCIDCPEFCSECVDDHTCVQCTEGAVRLDTGLCAEACPSLKYLAPDHTCKPCHHSCLSCNGSADEDCTSCPGQLSLDGGQCVLRDPESCTQGQYFDHRGLECRSCHSTCRNCTGKESDQCTVCHDDFVLDGGRCSPKQVVVECQHKEYLDRENSLCNPCPTGCQFCSSNDTCSECENALFLTTTGLCVEHCPNRTVTNNESRLCLDTLCSEHCRTCFGVGDKSCTSCVKGSFLFEHQCLQVCPPHTFNSVDGSMCVHCDDSCATCDGPSNTNCLSCPDGILFNNQCISSCPSGYFITGQQCTQCPSNCQQCSSAQSCEACVKNYYILSTNHTCVKTCPMKFVAQMATKTCLPCPANCLTCNSPTTCSKCEDQFIYYAPNRSCMSHCPDGYFSQQGSHQCTECKYPCSTCEGGPRQCLACAANLVLDPSSNKCVQCCNSDKPSLPCCDCDVSKTECVLKDTLETQEPLVEETYHTNYILYTVVCVLVIAILGILIVVVVYRKRKSHAIARRRYKTLDLDELHITDNPSGSEAEIYTAPRAGPKGYTSVDTIDHDHM